MTFVRQITEILFAALVKVQHLNPQLPPVPTDSSFLSFLRKFASDIMQK